MFPTVDSPFTDKLGTNCVLSDAKVKQLRALLVEPINELARIDAQIAEMEDTLRELKAKGSLLKAAIDAHKALMSPIRGIPEDLLQEIFIACLPTAHIAVMDPSEAPLLLGRICSQWRNVAYSTPKLWASLHLPPLAPNWGSPMPQENEHNFKKVVESWLDRSAACPLSISLTRFLVYKPFPTRIMDLLIGVSHRLRALSLFAPVSDVRPLLVLGGDNFPSLEGLHIDSISSSNPVGFWANASMLQAPNLREIALQITADPLTLPLPWAQLTDLSLECFPELANPQSDLDQNGAWELFHRCPNLVRCCLRATKSDPFIMRPTIALPHLQTLILLGTFTPEIFIQCLLCPNLRYLAVGEEFPDSRSLFSIDSDNSTDELTLELLSGCQLSHNQLLALSITLPGISRLRVSDYFLQDGFLDHLQTISNDIISYPALNHIDFGATCHFSDAALLNCIQFRMNAGDPLQRLTAIFARPMVLDISQELQPAISNGFQLDLQYISLPPWKFDPRQGITI